jgi:hypothetical protein
LNEMWPNVLWIQITQIQLHAVVCCLDIEMLKFSFGLLRYNVVSAHHGHERKVTKYSNWK